MAQELPFGRQVRERRRALDLTQEELARRVGCAAVTVRKIEAGDMRASQQIAERLAVALGIALDERGAFVRLARSVAPEARAVSPSPRTPLLAPEEIGAADLSGREIRGYQLGERVGAGGFGAVYRAVQPLVERDVAVKIILPQFADHPDFVRRFEAEAQLVARLEHPHIVPLYDYWREPGVAYLVMRYLRGGTLNALLKQGPPPLSATLRLIEQIGAALASAHRAGVVHRDLKPANILLDEEGNAYVADFGIAKDLARPAAEHSLGGAFVGSPAYSSPEQIRAEQVSPQTDIYALGVLLYELLTGHRPFDGPTPVAYIQQHLSAPVPLLGERRRGLPAPLDRIVQRATAKVPSARYPTMHELLAELRATLSAREAPAGAAPPPGTERTARSAIAAPPTLVLDLADSDNPFKGLRPFEEADAADFFGRESLIQQLLGRMGESGELCRFLAVVGPSGSGKSSVVRAGLVPALRAGGLQGSEQWYVLDLLPGTHPLRELAAALGRVAPAGVESDDLLTLLRADNRGLLRAARLVLPPDGAELVLVIDQFEELFTLTADEAERAHLLDSIVTATLDERSRLRVVVTLRADFIDRPLQYVDFGELLRQRTELVLPLTPEEVERAVTGPARRAGLALEEALAANIIADVGGQPGVLPLLQHALSELFERREGRVLTRAAYRQIGGVTGALARSAEAIVGKLDAPAGETARQLFLQLIVPGEGAEDSRRRVRRSELEVAGPPAAVAQVVEAFGRARLLTFDHDPATREPTVEVAHEALLREWPRLRGWVDAARADLLLQRQLAQAAGEWAAGGRDASYLAMGARLAHFSALEEGGALRLGERERAYLAASRAAQKAQASAERERAEHELQQAQALAAEQRARADEQALAGRRLRRRAWLLAVAFALTAITAVAAIGLAGRNASLADTSARAATTAQAAESQAVAAQATAQAERDRAEAEADIASARAFAASALNSLTVDPERSILLGLHALEQADIPEAQDALHQAVSASRARRTLRGHADEVWSVAFSPDGSTLASGSYDSTVKLWEASSGRELRTLDGHSGVVYKLAFSPNGSLLVSASEDGTAVVWEVATGDQLHTLAGHSDVVNEVAFSPDGELVATGSVDGTVVVWEAESGEAVRLLEGPAEIDALAISPDGQQLVAGGGEGLVTIWDMATGEQRQRFAAHDDYIIDLDISPDGALLAIAGFGGITRVYETTTQTTLYSLAGHTSSLSAILFTPDGSRIITASQDGSAKGWEVATGRELFSLSGHTGAGSIYGLAIAPSCLKPPAAPFAWCGTNLATASRDYTVKLWDISPVGQRELTTVPGFIATFVGEDAELRTAGYSDDNQAIVQTWQNKLREPAGEYTPPSTTITTGSLSLEELELSTAGSVLGFALSPDGTRLAKGSDEGSVTVWDATNGTELLSLRGLTGRIESLVFSPDNKRLAAASFDTFAKVWDVATGEEQLTLRGHTGELVGIAFSADGRRLVTGGGSGDNMAKVWNATTGEELLSVTGHTSGVVPVAFSPDGAYIATGGRDGIAKLWDATTGEELLTLSGHSAALRSIAFSPDGRLLATGSGDATLRIWSIAEGPDRGQNLLVLRGHAASVRSIAFSPDGKLVASGSRDGTVRVFALDRETLVALARARLTRSWTAQECLQYLRAESCPQEP